MKAVSNQYISCYMLVKLKSQRLHLPSFRSLHVAEQLNCFWAQAELHSDQELISFNGCLPFVMVRNLNFETSQCAILI